MNPAMDELDLPRSTNHHGNSTLCIFFNGKTHKCEASLITRVLIGGDGICDATHSAKHHPSSSGLEMR